MKALDRLPLLSGPAALAGFFLPWFEGRGPLVGERYNGYNAMQFGAWLQEAGFGPWTNLALEASRILAAGIVVAAFWLTLTTPTMRDHVLHRAAGLYLVSASLALAAFTAAWNQTLIALPGVALILIAALSWLAHIALHLPAGPLWHRPPTATAREP